MVSAIPQTMTAVEIASPGGPEVLRPVARPTPHPGPREVLIAVAAAGVNRPDLLQRQGKYAPPPGASDIPGLEVAGHVVARGKDVDEWREGDPVCALVAGGGYAEYCAAPVPQCLPVPKGLDLVQAAALPETVFTVWTNVFERGRLSAGETLLVHGGASGIGTTAIQIARARGVRVLATAGTPDKCARLRAVGRRARHRLCARGLRVGRRRADVREGRRRHPGHGRRRLPAPQPRLPGRGGAARADRVPQGAARGDRPHAHHAPPPHPDRLHLARALDRGEGPDRRAPCARTCGR